MSRTYNTAPLWVQELRYGRVEHTCHSQFEGKPIYRSVLARNEDGTPKTKKVRVLNKVAGYRIYYKGEDQPFTYAFSCTEAFMARRKGYHVETMYKDGWEVSQYYIQVLVGHYTEECTDEHVRYINSLRPYKWYRSNGTQCHLRLPKTKWSKWNRPRKDDRRNHHKAARQQETNNLNQYRNLHNSGTDLNDVDLLETETRELHHQGWWD